MEKWIEDAKNDPVNAHKYARKELERRIQKRMAEDLIERHRRAWFGPNEPSGILSQELADIAKSL